MERNQDKIDGGLATTSEVALAVSMTGSESELLIDVVVNDVASQSSAVYSPSPVVAHVPSMSEGGNGSRGNGGREG